MYVSNYHSIVKNSIIAQSNLYNVFKSDINYKLVTSTRFNTFKNEKSLKFIRLYKLAFLFSNQRPFLKKIKFNYTKKKILKRFFLTITFNYKKSSNFLLYLNTFYLYFFHMYYQDKIKYNAFTNNFILYLDNIQLFIKNYGKHAQRTQLQTMFISDNLNHNLLFKYLSNLFILELKK